MDRSGELRNQPEILEQLWHEALIIEVGKGRIRSTAEGLSFIDPALAVGGERYFLGIDRATGSSYFAWASGAVVSDVADYLSLRELAGGQYSRAKSVYRRGFLSQRFYRNTSKSVQNSAQLEPSPEHPFETCLHHVHSQRREVQTR